MIITCPACEAQYLLPDDSIGPNGRRVKCTSCSYTWLQSSLEDEDVLTAKELSFEPERGAKRQIVESPYITPVTVEKKRGRIFIFGVGLALCLLALTLALLILYKEKTVGMWQPFALFYETIGIKVETPGAGLAFDKISAASDTQGHLKLKGNIVNRSKALKTLPKLLIRLSGEKGWLKDWTIDLHNSPIQANASIGFDYSLPDAPAQGREVTLRFAN